MPDVAASEVIAAWRPSAIAACARSDSDPDEFIRLCALLGGAWLVVAGRPRSEGCQFATWLEVNAFLYFERQMRVIN